MSDANSQRAALGFRFWLITALMVPCAFIAVRRSDDQFMRVHQPDRFSWAESPRTVIFLWAERLFLDSVPLLCATSLSLALGLKWRGTRDTGWASPGQIAVLLTLVVFLLYSMRHAIWWWFDKEHNLFSLWFRAGNHGAIAILGGWTLLAVAGAWRSQPKWADRLGRILGCCWLAVALTWWSVWAMFS
jgi:hypothetical protein